MSSAVLGRGHGAAISSIHTKLVRAVALKQRAILRAEQLTHKSEAARAQASTLAAGKCRRMLGTATSHWPPRTQGTSAW